MKTSAEAWFVTVALSQEAKHRITTINENVLFDLIALISGMLDFTSYKINKTLPGFYKKRRY